MGLLGCVCCGADRVSSSATYRGPQVGTGWGDIGGSGLSFVEAITIQHGAIGQSRDATKQKGGNNSE